MYVDYFLRVAINREKGYRCNKMFPQFIMVNAIHFHSCFGFLLMMGYVFVYFISCKS